MLGHDLEPEDRLRERRARRRRRHLAPDRGEQHWSGILIIENGAAEIAGSFRWNGLVIASGKNVGIRYLGGGNQQIYGATIVNELDAGAAASFTSDASGNGDLLYSREALDLVQNALSRRLVTVYHWADQ